jgi:hypothetical protein
MSMVGFLINLFWPSPVAYSKAHLLAFLDMGPCPLVSFPPSLGCFQVLGGSHPSDWRFSLELRTGQWKPEMPTAKRTGFKVLTGAENRPVRTGNVHCQENRIEGSHWSWESASENRRCQLPREPDWRFSLEPRIGWESAVRTGGVNCQENRIEGSHWSGQSPSENRPTLGAYIW